MSAQLRAFVKYVTETRPSIRQPSIVPELQGRSESIIFGVSPGVVFDACDLSIDKSLESNKLTAGRRRRLHLRAHRYFSPLFPRFTGIDQGAVEKSALSSTPFYIDTERCSRDCVGVASVSTTTFARESGTEKPTRTGALHSVEHGYFFRLRVIAVPCNL